MLVLRQGTPHATVDAVSHPRYIWHRGALGCRLERCEDEFWGGELRHMFFEGWLPWGGRRGQLSCCAGHGAEEGAETEGRKGSYGC